MDQTLSLTFVAALTGGLCLAALRMAKRDAIGRAGTRGPWFIVAAIGLVVLLFLSSDGWISGVPSVEFAFALVGYALLFVSAAGCVRASRLRARAELLLGSAPIPVDEALARSREVPVCGVFEGRVVGADPVTSPGGIVCAAYSAEVRQVARDGERGSLLSIDHASPSLLPLQGKRSGVFVSFSERQWRAPLEIRRCGPVLSPGMIASSGEAANGGEVGPGTEALSWERIVRLGEPVLVVGTLVRMGHDRAPLVRGIRAGPAFVVASVDAKEAGRALRIDALRAYGAAVACAAVAAFFLTR